MKLLAWRTVRSVAITLFLRVIGQPVISMKDQERSILTRLFLCLQFVQARETRDRLLKDPA